MYSASRKLAALLCCLMVFAAQNAFAQQGTPANSSVKQTSRATHSDDAPKRRVRGRATLRRVRKGATEFARTPSPSSPRAANPVALVNGSTGPEYLFGQAEVIVKGNQDPIIRLGLAQNGSAVVEFPASDTFFAVHPGGSNVVAVDESPTLATDHYLVFRAGRDFVAPPADSKKRPLPEATVSVQMQSGIFVTFMFYPVHNVAQMAHRCVVSYSREEVIAARRAVGLAVNLDGKHPQSSTTPVASKRIADSSATQGVMPSPSTVNLAASNQSHVTQPVANITQGGGSNANTAPTANKRKRPAADMTAEAQRSLQLALAAPTKFTKWSAGTHGLSLSALTPVEIDERHRLAVVAIKNTGATGVRLVAGHPDIDLETVGERNQPVQTQPIVKLHSQSTALGDAIPAGAVVYYAIIYETPVRGAKQRLRLSVAHIDAADEPASVTLPK